MALIQCSEVNPEVQNRDLDTQLLFLCFLFLFLRGLCYTCIPFDASALLWKVNDKYDPNLTILCTFLHRGGRFTALKKKKKRSSWVPWCFTSPSGSVTVNYFFPREMGTNEWQVHVKPSAQQLGRYCSMHWACLASLAYCLSPRPCQH